MSVILGGAQQQHQKRRPTTEKVMKQKPKITVPALAKPNTRPLNSFIAFRSYYSPLFSSLQQKAISGFLTYLWQHDLFQAKWAILAKAYSVIRDTKGKANTPLDRFLSVNGPFIGVISPSDYLALMGWEMIVNNEGQLNLTRLFIPQAANFDEALRANNVSVHDILHHSCEKGYVADYDGNFDRRVPMTAEQHLMASAAQPTLPRTTQPATIVQDTGTVQPITLHPGSSPQSNNLQLAYNRLVLRTESSPVPTTQALQQVDILGGESLTTLDTSLGDTDFLAAQGEPQAELPEQDNSLSSDATLAPAVPWWQRSLDDFNAAGDQEFPFNNQFDPDLDTNLLFDPFEGDTFNPFELSDFINEDAYE